ncbi:MGMT family protein, partial [Lactobacillus paragasseri]
VWLALLEIPYGEVTTYKKIAEKVAGRADHLPIRAVGSAVGRNHIALIVPCHRVIGSNGNLTGYSGGIDKKIQLLQLEGIDISKFSLPANYK